MSDDRTSEFFSLARSLPQEQQDQAAVNSSSLPSGSALPPFASTSTTALASTGRYGKTGTGMTTPSSSSSAAYNDLRAFHKTAADIAKDIAATSAMLTELALLVKQKSLFDQDSSSASSTTDGQLVVHIKTNIENLNTRLDQANSVLQQQKRRLNTQAGQEATNMVGQLKEEFVEATTGFQKVLQQRTDTLKQREDRKRLVYGDFDNATASTAASSTADQPSTHVILDNRPPVYSSTSRTATSATAAAGVASSQFPTLDLTSGMQMAAGESTSSRSSNSTPQLPRPPGVAGYGGGGSYGTPQGGAALPSFSGGMSSFHGSGTSTPLTPLDIQRMEQESEQMMTQLIPDQSYLRERADAMSEVETNIAELGAVFNKLAVMVTEHGEMVQRVEDNVDDVESNVNLSLQVLQDTLYNLRTNRALFAKVFSIIVVFIIMFIVFFA